jgi:transcriptional regulator with XRE-family HTH domain
LKFGSILKACRERAGFSQEEMAFRMNVTQSAISKYEKDKRSMDIQTFKRWFQETSTQEVAVAFLYGMDGVSILQQLTTLLPMFAGPLSLLFWI